jgi:class 3 adenylate cyclase/TolB-like protein/tetratricopeptide (TPR) repeat protein
VSETRKLAAILVADIVGYSRLAGADEDRILARLRTLRSDLIDPILAVHHGRVVKRTGDGAIVEFRSVVDAVRCAIEVQSGLAERNTGLPPEKRIEYRVGIHVGDVVEESDGDLMGDGVNIAARLEGVAKPGAICLSEQAYWQVKGRLDLTVTDLGKTPLKNIAEPVHAYSVEGGKPAQAKSAPQGKPATPPDKPRGLLHRWPAIAAALAVIVLGAGAYAWHSGIAGRLLGVSVAEDKLANAPRLSIVVLPFENLSGDKEQDYFADGITDDLTTDLSHMPDSFVISRGTAFTYKGKPIDTKTIGRDLGVRYALEGSVRRAGEKVEVNAQLIDAATGAHVWADRFEGDRSKLGDLQVEVVSRLARSLGVELVKAEALRAGRERPSNPDAVDLTLRGWALIYSNPTGADMQEAESLFERALALDPSNVPAMIGLASALKWLVDMSWLMNTDYPSGIARAEESIDAALALEPDNSSAHETKGWASFIKGYWARAVVEGEAAIADDRNNAGARADTGFWKMFVGRSADSVADLETALRLSPRDPMMPYWRWWMCRLQSHLGVWEKAIEWCNIAVASGPGGYSAREMLASLAAAHAWAGHDNEAKDALAQLFKVDPNFGARDYEAWSGNFSDPTFMAERTRIIEGLRKAGLP